MRLLRFAIVTLNGDPRDWTRFSVEHEGCSVGTLHEQEIGGWRWRIWLVAETPLTERPATDDANMVTVPEGPRRTAEEALEVAANLVSVATGHARQLSSPGLVIAYRAEDEGERTWLEARAGIVGGDRGFAAGRLTVAVRESELAQLSGRDDGVELLGEALAQDHLMGRYRELLRVFERAFAESGDRLVPHLGRFLMSRPGLGYSKQEVNRWIVRLRGGAIHQDRDRELVVEADVRGVIDRMLLAAYEVLFNKRDWRSTDSNRRAVWTPEIGPLDPNGRWFVLQHSAPVLQTQLYDRFGAYVLDTSAPAFGLGDDCWPRRGPLSVTAAQAQVEIVPAERLAPSQPYAHSPQPAKHLG